MTYETHLCARRRLSSRAFELDVKRPSGLQFAPGQGIRVIFKDLQRVYTPVSRADDPNLTFCIADREAGRMVSALSHEPMGAQLVLSGPEGYFTYQSRERPVVFIATGAGVAPFVAMARAGTRDFILLHGVPSTEDLHYRALLEPAARRYVACVPADVAPDDAFRGRVSEYLRRELPPRRYDFYVCGNATMVRDVTFAIDAGFPDPVVYVEPF